MKSVPMKSLVGGLLGLLLVGACSAAPADPLPGEQGDQEGGLGRDVRTAGGCACPAEAGAAAEISIDCFCAEFPEACPSYDELKTPTTPPWLHSQCVAGDPSWEVTEQVGCGQLMVSRTGSYGGWTYVYDEQTHELIGAASYSDIGLGACGTSTYYAGVHATCTEGTVCSLCDTTREACVPACSMAALPHQSLGGPHLRMDPQDCTGVEAGQRPLVTTGCGLITVTEGGSSSTFDATSLQAVGWVSSFKDDLCRGHWGDAPAACAEQTTCTLCQGASNSCAR